MERALTSYTTAVFDHDLSIDFGPRLPSVGWSDPVMDTHDDGFQPDILGISTLRGKWVGVTSKLASHRGDVLIRSLC
jgi:hypothetical protein